MLLVIDNYDSFTYNLVQYVTEAIGCDATFHTGATPPESANVWVARNDEITTTEIKACRPHGIVISPGPGTPTEAGISIDIFDELTYPTLGVCLGHQALCHANGIPVSHAPEVIHGKASVVTHDDETLFANLPNPLRVGRYHSLAVTRKDLRPPLVEIAKPTDERQIVMGVRHTEKPHFGVQFHPESILTGELTDSPDAVRSLRVGKQIIRNFVTTCFTT